MTAIRNIAAAVSCILCVAVLAIASSSDAACQSRRSPNGQQPGIDRIAPNPLSVGTTEIRFVLPRAGQFTVSIYSLDGSLIASLLAEDAPAAGLRVVSWDGRARDGTAVGNGMYLCRLAVGSFVRSKPLIVMR